MKLESLVIVGQLYDVGELYTYEHSNVWFKPTKAAEFQFHPTPEDQSFMSEVAEGMRQAEGLAAMVEIARR